MRRIVVKNSPLELRKIKNYANWRIGSDTRPAEVVRVISENCVEIRRMKSVQTVYPQRLIPGGFTAFILDNENQNYTYFSDLGAPTLKIRWSKAKSRWQDSNGNRYLMSDSPVSFHDYTF